MEKPTKNFLDQMTCRTRNVFIALALICSIYVIAKQPNMDYDVLNRIRSTIRSEDGIEILYTVGGWHNFNTTFFIESSGIGYLNDRYACSVEAAARLQHPLPVILYMTGIKKEAIARYNPWTKNFTNLKLVKVDPGILFKNTSFDRLYLDVKGQATDLTEHISDMMRVFLLKHYGGLYLDTDTVLLKNTSSFDSFLLYNLVNGIMKFESNHFLINEMYNTLAQKKYNNRSWDGLGFRTILDITKKYCKLSLEKGNFDEAGKNCNLTFLRTETFLPIKWVDWKNGLFIQSFKKLEDFRPNVMKNAYGIHFNNHLTSNIPIVRKKGQIHEIIAEQYCPLVYSTLPKVY
ncbi:lactosylceramide 4-alpha-galactosyltransferase-like isoform X3 [Artemia franciscana]|uniref:lactosylceramide 4-alpha-galactosyltransferase-like isoform X3 n=1 Tax=Artemia franciscana TaxID=6661 RepID=UPI0032DBDE14